MKYKKQVILLLLLITSYHFAYGLETPFINDSINAWIWQWISSTTSDNPGNNDLNWWNQSHGMKSNFINEIWIKTKIFTQWTSISPSMVYAWYDINGDGKQNLLYWYWGKLYLHDLASWLNIWETKVLWISEVISIESILWNNFEKQIIVKFWNNPWYMGLIDGKTGELINSSQSFYYQMKNVSLTNDSSTNYIIKRDTILNKTYIIFQNNLSKDFAMELSLQWWKPQLTPFYTDETLHGSETWNGVNNSYETIWKINGKYYTVTANDAKFKVLDLSTANSGSSYVPQAVINTSYSNVHWVYQTKSSFFYDFNNDGNDEFIVWSPNKKYTTWWPYRDWFIIVWWTTNTGSVWNYWSYSTSSFDENSANLWIRDVKVAKNYSDLSDSHIFVYNATDANRKVFWVRWNSWDVYPTAFPGGHNQNFDLKYTYDKSQWDISGIFNNGSKDLIMTNQNWKFNFYLYSWSGTFSTWSTAILGWSYYSIACNKDKLAYYNMPWYYCGIDSDNNGYTEFITANNWYIVFNEVRENNWELKIFEVKKIKYSWLETWSVIARGLTSDFWNIWSVSYDSVTNKLRVFYWDLTSSITSNGTEIFELKRVDLDTIYSWWVTFNPKVVKLWWKNYVMINSKLYDFSEASPTISPNISNANFPNWYVLDVDPVKNDGNEFINDWKTYNINVDNTIGTVKYSNDLLSADFDKDGILDKLERRVSSTSINWYTPADYRIISWSGGNEIVPWTIIWGCWHYWNLGIKYFDYNWDWVDDIITGSTWCYGGWIYSWVDLSRIWNFNWERDLVLSDLNATGKNDSIISRNANFRNYYIKRTNFLWSGALTTPWTTINIPDPVFIWDWDVSTLSINKSLEKTDVLFKIYNGRILWIDINTWIIKYDKMYFWWKSYSNATGSTFDYKIWYDAIFADGGVPIHAPSVLVMDINNDGKNEWVISSRDWYFYIINIDTWNILKTYNLWISIQSMVSWDINNDGILDILVSSEDRYVYQIANSNLSEPVWVKDGQNYWFDIETQTLNNKVNLNYAKVAKATWYFVQLYNKTEKSIVFDWINVWNKYKACIRSSDVIDDTCISAGKTFSLNGKSIYEWRVQSYNANVTSAITNSNWFSVLRLTMDKKVAKKEDLDFLDEVTVPPNTLLTYKIIVWNDSLNTVWWAWYMNYDMMPAQSASNCLWIIDCRTKNIIISDYMPSTFTYMPNSTIWIVKKINYDGTEDILYWWSQVSDSYFKIQSGTKLTTNAGATLAWEFPNTISIPPWAFLELQFDAIARQ